MNEKKLQNIVNYHSRKIGLNLKVGVDIIENCKRGAAGIDCREDKIWFNKRYLEELEKVGEEKIRAVITHELAHIKYHCGFLNDLKIIPGTVVDRITSLINLRVSLPSHRNNEFAADRITKENQDLYKIEDLKVAIKIAGKYPKSFWNKIFPHPTNVERFELLDDC
jgi:hypothetical protein